MLSLEVSALSNSILWQGPGQDTPDTLSNYIGNSTWMEDNNLIEFRDGELHLDVVSGHYVLEKR